MRPMAEPVAWSAADWALCGQGRSNVVCRDGRGAVLRIQRHTPRVVDSVHDALELELWAHVSGFREAATQAERSWLFAKHVLAPLLDFRDGVGTLVDLPPVFLQELESRLELPPGALGSRTESKRWAVLLPDHTHMPPSVGCTAPVFVVELKPKCGFIPFAVPEGSVKLRTTRFALHQRLKLAQGRIKQVSGYCPLHLFSGDNHRMRAAIHALLSTPQNNLSIRRDGVLVFGHAGDSHIDSDGSFITAQSTHDMLSSTLNGLGASDMPAHAHIELLVSLLVRILQCSCALQRLLAVQKLDTHDVDNAFQTYQRLLAPTIENADICAVDPLETGKRAASQPSRHEALVVLRDFLIAQAAKDCGIMVCLQRLPEGHSFADNEAEGCVAVDEATGVCVRYSVAFVDMDLKPVDRMPRYRALDQAIQEANKQ